MRIGKQPMKDIDSRRRTNPIAPRKHASGNWNPDWEPFAKLDPAWTEKVIAMAIAPVVAGALDPKTIELIGIALDASCTHMYAPGWRDEGRDHRGIAARELAGTAQHVPERTHPPRRIGSQCPTQGLNLVQ
jgi:hypothetical protein